MELVLDLQAMEAPAGGGGGGGVGSHLSLALCASVTSHLLCEQRTED
jgi:hypothetical protein